MNKLVTPSPSAKRPVLGTAHRVAWFERRHGDGRYENLLGPMRPTDRAVQQALIAPAVESERRRERVFVWAVIVVGLIGLVVSA